MKSPQPYLSCRGFALIVTLAMITMLAFVAVAFLSRTITNRQIESGSTAGARADILAKSAAEIIVSDLKTEIVAGSTAIGNGSEPKLYRPLSNRNMVPALVRGTGIPANDPVFPNLVKQSTGRFFPNSPDFPNGSPIIQGDSGIVTDKPAQNNRVVRRERWDNPSGFSPRGPLLLLGGGTSSRFYGDARMPRWILITRDGVPSSQTWENAFKDYTPGNSKAVIGRFAYNIYDQGGLLDINVAGYPSGLPASVLGRKGSLALAQLAVIPGIGSDANAEKFAGGWRDLASGSTTDNFLAYLGFSKNNNTDLTGNPFYNQGPGSGFLKSAAGSDSADNRILGRQDLIRLAVKNSPGAPTYGISPAALPYLTHFSREVNAPSWSPSNDAFSLGGQDGIGTPQPYAYKTNADNPSVPNRFLPNVRVVGGFTRADGTQAIVGEPLLKTRFPLSRLESLGLTGVNSNARVLNAGGLQNATASTVQRDFGLQWDNTDKKWNYTGHPGSTIQSTIKTLAVVASENREPNFFELLKAGILSGSLANASDFEGFSSTMGEDANADYHIMQIGANIIDQSDSDGFPTRIAFGFELDAPSNLVAARGPGNATASTGEVKVFSGVEDLPYLYTILSTAYRRPDGQPNLGNSPIDPNQNATRDYINGWLQFVLWKPQQPATTTVSPSNFRIQYSGAGAFMQYWGNNSSPIEFPIGSGINYGTRDTAPTLQNATINFTDAPTSFRAPALLGGTGDTSIHGFNASQPNGNGGSAGAGRLPRGMWLGETYRPERIYTAGSPNQTAPFTTFLQFVFPSDSRFELQYEDSAGVWRTYQRFDRVGMGTTYFRNRSYGYSDDHSQFSNIEGPVSPASDRYPAYRALDIANIAVSVADPRSQRFGLMGMFTVGGAMPPMLPAGDWTAYLKNGWAPLDTSVSPGFLSTMGPSRAGFTPSWSGGTSMNPWSARASQNPIGEPTTLWANNPGVGGYFYEDSDRISRRADGDSANNVRPMQLVDASTPNSDALSIILNRPFQSVGELAHVFRDEPYKTLNLFTASSADSALLDIFSVNEQPPIVAGKVNLNTRNPVVLQALLAGAFRQESSNPVSPTTGATSASEMAAKLVANTKDTSGNINTGPIPNPAELANRMNAILPMIPASDQAIKIRREVVARALAGSTQTRTWNLLIDVTAQSGQFPASATNNANFLVEGEKRYWLHVAIDRITGQIIDQQLEPIME